MHFTLDQRPVSRRLPAIAATVAVHVLILSAMVLSSADPEQIQAGRTMEFWFPEVMRPVPVPRSATPPRTRRTSAPAAARPAQPRAVTTSDPAAPAAADTEPAAEALPAEPASAASAADILSRARSDIGAIDRDMRKQIPKGLVRAPVMTAQKRLEKGIALAAEMAPPKWYEAPKITELIDPGGWGKKRYRVITANGTYCLTYNTSHGNGGSDPFKNRPPPPMTTCDPKEQPPTTQP